MTLILLLSPTGLDGPGNYASFCAARSDLLVVLMALGALVPGVLNRG
jgi:hypothetical protein